MEYTYAGRGLDLAWTRLPDIIKTVRIDGSRTGQLAVYTRFDEAGTTRLTAAGFFVSSIRSTAPMTLKLGPRTVVCEGEVIIVGGPGTHFEATFSGARTAEFVSMSPEALDSVFNCDVGDRIKPVIYGATDVTAMRPLIETIKLCLAQKDDVDHLVYESILTAMVRLAVTPDEAAVHPPGLTIEQVCTVRAHILNGLTGPLSVGELAAAVNLSTGHFARAFKQSFGASPYQYVLRERVSIARSLITEREYSLETIALRAGFSNVAHMTRALKAQAGHTARAMRALRSHGKRVVPIHHNDYEAVEAG